MASVLRYSLWPPSRTLSPLVKEDICTADPTDQPREWIYQEPAIGFVLSGHFEYRAESGVTLGVPGGVVFGNAGEHFSVRHLDTRGNKRLVVFVTKDILEEAAHSCGLADARFRVGVLPPSRSTSLMFGWMRRLALGLPDDHTQGRAAH